MKFTPEIIAAIFAGLATIIGAITTAITTINNARQKRIEKETVAQSGKLQEQDKKLDSIEQQAAELVNGLIDRVQKITYDVVSEGLLASIREQLADQNAIIIARIERIERKLQMSFFQLIGGMMQDYVVKAIKNPDFQDSAVNFLRGVGRSILENRNNPAKMEEIGHALNDHPKNTLGAIVIGTPAEKLVAPSIVEPAKQVATSRDNTQSGL